MEENREQYIELFKEESREYLRELDKLVVDLENNPGEESTISEIYRIFHTLKGMAASLGFSEIEGISHDLEEKLENAKDTGRVKKDTVDEIFEGLDRIENIINKSDSGKTEEKKTKKGENLKILLKDEVKLPAARAVAIINLIEEKTEVLKVEPPEDEIRKGNINKEFMVTCSDAKSIRKILEGMEEVEKVSSVSKRVGGKIESGTGIGSLGGIRVNVDLLDRLQNLVGELVVSTSQIRSISENFGGVKFKRVMESHSRNVKDLQEIVTKIRLVPLSLIFNKFPRYVRDLSGDLNKKVDIDITGSDIEVDRSLLESISDPLLHLIRNAVSHGIESAERRRELGKPETGKIKVRAKRVKGDILIEVSDDGRGIDEKEILLAAFRKGMIDEEEMESMSSTEIMRFLFFPGFTTREEADEVSGRGVGLDVVARLVRSAGGSVNINAEKDRGTTVSMKMPLSMAIIKVYLVDMSGETFAIPMTFVDETLMLSNQYLSSLLGKDVMILRDEVLPVYRFSKILGEGITGYEDKEQIPCIVVDIENERFALLVDNFKGSTDAVVKRLPTPIDEIKGYTGITIIGEGKPCLILDLPSLRYRRKYENTGS